MAKLERAARGGSNGGGLAPTPSSRPQLIAGEGELGGPSPSLQKYGSKRLPIKASLELALLGLIAESRAISGYDLVKTFDASMVHYWHALHGQIYPTLDRMREAGLVNSRDVIQRRRPNKRLYSITNAGRLRLLKWLLGPAEPFKLKHAQLLRTRFLGHLGPEAACAKLREERELWSGVLATYRGFEGKFARERGYRNSNTMFSYFTLRYGIIFAQQTIAFCDWALEEIMRNAELFRAAGKDPSSEVSRSKAR